MSILGRRLARAVAASVLAATAVVAGTGGGAGAADIATLRERAQSLGDEVSSLERDLAGLNERKSRLAAGITVASAEIGALEADLHDADAAYYEALDHYVARAVVAYKEGPAADLAMLLSTKSLDDLFAAAEVASRSAEQDGEALDDLVAARAEAERAQEEIDDRKQELLAKHAAIDEVTTEIEIGIGARRAVMRKLAREIKTLERRALLAAAGTARPDVSLLRLLDGSGPVQGIPGGFAGTGVTFGGIASWYGPGFEGNPTANGDIFDPDLFTAASRDLPLGTWLYVTHEGRGVVVLVNDRGPYIDGRVLDLSRAAAFAIGITGIGWVDAEILIKTR